MKRLKPSLKQPGYSLKNIHSSTNWNLLTNCLNGYLTNTILMTTQNKSINSIYTIKIKLQNFIKLIKILKPVKEENKRERMQNAQRIEKEASKWK